MYVRLLVHEVDPDHLERCRPSGHHVCRTRPPLVDEERPCYRGVPELCPCILQYTYTVYVHVLVLEYKHVQRVFSCRVRVLQYTCTTRVPKMVYQVHSEYTRVPLLTRVLSTYEYHGTRIVYEYTCTCTAHVYSSTPSTMVVAPLIATSILAS